jgi:hypothetical protein
VTEVAWSSSNGVTSIRLTGVPPGARIEVRPSSDTGPDRYQPMAGRLHDDSGSVSFVPRFAFVDGTPYAVSVAGRTVAVLRRPAATPMATTSVQAIHPAVLTVPRNLLRFYVTFTAPMSEGWAATHVRLEDEAGDPMSGALLPSEQELWDGARRRLTVLLDPARIKRGLAGHRALGYPLRRGESFGLVVEPGLRDARGNPLTAPAARRYAVGDDEQRRVVPADWELRVPPAHTRRPLEVRFDRPLDHGLLARCLRVVGPAGPVTGRAGTGADDRTWELRPLEPWAPGAHQLVVDPALEDLAGNSVRRPFDRDLEAPGEAPGPAGPVTLAFGVS